MLNLETAERVRQALNGIDLRVRRFVIIAVIPTLVLSIGIFREAKRSKQKREYQVNYMARAFTQEHMDFARYPERYQHLPNQNRRMNGLEFCGYMKRISRNFEWNECHIPEDVEVILDINDGEGCATATFVGDIDWSPKVYVVESGTKDARQTRWVSP